MATSCGNALAAARSADGNDGVLLFSWSTAVIYDILRTVVNVIRWRRGLRSGLAHRWRTVVTSCYCIRRALS